MKRRFFTRGNSKRARTGNYRSSLVPRAELLEAKMMLTGDIAHNFSSPNDVNDDGFVSLRDAAMLVWKFSTSSARAAASTGEGEPPMGPQPAPTVFYDVTGDGVLNATDVDTLVDALNRGAGEPGDVVTFRLETTDLSGVPISTIDAGQVFELRVFTQDTQEMAERDEFGVFAAYLDVAYNAGLASVAGPIEYANSFDSGRSGSTSVPGIIDDVGAFRSSFTPPGRDEIELFSIRLRADAPGTLNITSSPASPNPDDVNPFTEISIYSSDDPVSNDDILFGSTTIEITGAQQAEPDLVAFAKALDEAGVVLWTTTLSARGRIGGQLDLFEEGEHFLPIREILEPAPEGDEENLQFTQEAIDADRTRANVWVFPDGSDTNGALLSLAEISQRSGVPIPTGSAPTIVPIGDVTVLRGSPLHIPLDGYDPNGDPLSYTVTVESESVLETAILQGDRSLRLTTSDLQDDFGDMLFALFEEEANRATEQIITLTEDDFFDGITFHRVVHDFVLQTGDPTGTGRGGSDLGDFDDQFDLDLNHNRTGVLSMAKSEDDTNDSQFFITARPTRFLDFNHTVFGQLVEGDRVRETINNVDTVFVGGEKSSPALRVNLDDAEIVRDDENALLRLTGLGDGQTSVTVTATDVAGNMTTESFTVTLAEDTENGQPFLTDIPDQFFQSGEDIEFAITALDAEGDDVSFDAIVINNDDATVAVTDNGLTGLVTITPPAGFAGDIEVFITASPTDMTPFPPGSNPIDQQLVLVTIAAGGPTGVDLLAVTDSGAFDNDDVTNVTDLQFEVTGVVDGARVLILADGVEVGEGIASGDTITITTANPSALGDGLRVITAVQEVGGTRSLASPPLTIELDQTIPVAIDNDPSGEAAIGVRYAFDAAHDEEGSSGFRYSLGSAPSGMAINGTNGQITWTPTSSQRGLQSFEIVVTDLAGNSRSEMFQATVAGEIAVIQLVATNLDGDPIGGVEVGADFQLRVTVDDQRSDASGIRQAFVDITFDDSLAEVTGPIQFGASFPNENSGTVAAGTITDVGGSTTASLGAGQFLLATIPLRATTAGTIQFAAAVGDQDVFFSGDSNPLTAEDITLNNATLSILTAGEALAANDDVLVVDEDSGETEVQVLDNDVLGPNSGIVSITSSTAPNMDGTAVISDDRQSIFYTPADDFNGEETFTYTIRDGQGQEASATVTVTVNPVNDPPIANDDFFPAGLPPYDPRVDGDTDPRFFFVEDSGETIDLRPMSNDDNAPDGFDLNEIIRITSVGTQGTAGNVEINAAASNFGLLYTLAPNFFGDDTFTYTITDSHTPPLSATGTITVSIAQINDAPIAVADSFEVPPGGSLTIMPSQLTANDTAGPLEDLVQTLEVSGISSASTTKGTVVRNSDGSITYTPNPGATGQDTFSYTITDDGKTDEFLDANTIVTNDDPLEATGTVTLSLNIGNAAPDAFDDRISIVGGSEARTINVLGNDQDDGPAANLTVVAVTDPDQGGTVTLVDGVVSYQPAASFIGTEKFTYTISDGELQDTATVTVTVTDPATSTNSRFAGSVFFDYNNNGQRDSAERGIASVPIHLTGDDVNGNVVTRQAITDANGNYSFDALPKGTYTVRQAQSSLLLDGSESADPFAAADGDDAFVITVGDELVLSDGNTFAERGLSPKLAMIAATSSSRAATGFLTATANGQSQFMTSLLGWDDYAETNVAMSTDMSQVTITGTDKDSTVREATFAASDKSLVRVFGKDGDTVLLQIVGGSAAYDLQPKSVSGVSSAAVDAVFAANGPV